MKENPYENGHAFPARAYVVRSCAYAVALISLVFLSCNKSTGPADPGSSAPEVRWPGNPAQDYVIDQAVSCFCPPPWGFVRLTVVNNEIVEAIDLENQDTLTADERQRYKTIDELFEFVEKAEKRQPAVLRVEYDSTYGFPCKVYVDWVREIPDVQLGFETRLVEILP